MMKNSVHKNSANYIDQVLFFDYYQNLPEIIKNRKGK